MKYHANLPADVGAGEMLGAFTFWVRFPLRWSGNRTQKGFAWVPTGFLGGFLGLPGASWGFLVL